MCKGRWHGIAVTEGLYQKNYFYTAGGSSYHFTRCTVIIETPTRLSCDPAAACVYFFCWRHQMLMTSRCGNSFVRKTCARTAAPQIDTSLPRAMSPSARFTTCSAV